jgi:hypothetical protein
MNRYRIASAVLCLLFAAFACAAEPRQEPQPQQQEEPKTKPDKNASHEKDAKPPKQEEPKSKQDKEAPQDKASHVKDDRSPKVDESEPIKQEKQGKVDAKKDDKFQQGQSRPAGRTARIPDDKFHANFGRQHHFAIGHPQVVGAQPRFQYSGYSFEIVDPWPAGWAYSDDVYVDFVDGDYFIFDILHPGERIAVTVIM